MRRATITLSDDLDTALEAFIRGQEVAPALTSVVQVALREYLAGRGYAPPRRPFHIRPAKKGSGKKDVSANHDRYFAER